MVNVLMHFCAFIRHARAAVVAFVIDVVQSLANCSPFTRFVIHKKVIIYNNIV